MSLLEKLHQSNRYKYLPIEHFSWLRGWYNRFCSTIIVRPYLWAKYKPKVKGHKNIPKHGKFIAAANHVSLLDPPLIACALGRPTAFMAKKELFNTLVKAEFYHSVGCFLLDRDQPDITTIKTAFNLLKTRGDWVLGLFPEGTRSTDGKLLPLKKGIGAMASKTNTPVLPIGIRKLEDGRLYILIGELISDVSDADAVQDKVQEALTQLTSCELPS